MSCFTDYITVTGTCSDGTSASGYSLKDAGIMLTELNDVVTKDYANGKALGEAKIDFARKLVENRILEHFSGKLRANSIIEGQRIGYPTDNKVVESGTTGKFKGFELEVCNQDSFVSVYISELSLFLNHSGDVDVLVYDVKQAKLLDTITITAVAGEIVTSYVNKTYESDRKELHLAFIYDSDGVDAYQTYTKVAKGCRGCGTSGSQYINAYVTANGVSIDDADARTETNFDTIGHTAGLMAQFAINCNYSAWICSVKHQLALPILYKAAAEVMEFTLHTSDRENTRTLIDAEKNVERMAFYTTRYNETIDAVLKNMTLPNDGKCFGCKQVTRNVTMLP